MGGRRKNRGAREGRDETTQRIALMWVDSTPPTGAATLTPPGGTAIPPELGRVARSALDTAVRALVTLTTALLSVLRWTTRVSGRALVVSARWILTRPWRRIARVGSHRFVSLTIALGLAIVPGSLLLAVAALVWHRITAAAPLAYRPATPRVVQVAPAPPTAPAAAPTRLPATQAARPAVAKTPTPGPRPESRGPAVATLLPAAPTARVGAAPASCSAGNRSQGPLKNAASLPARGGGFQQIFPHRHLRYGTDEVVGAVRRTALSLKEVSSVPLMVGNLSGPAGSQEGQDPFHPALYSRSHGAGRAVDLAFPLVDALGRPAPAVETHLEFDESGRSVAGLRRLYVDATAPVPEGCRRHRIRAGLAEVACLIPEGAYAIDYDRGWKLVRALLLDTEIGVIDAQSGRSRPDGSGLRFLFVAPFIERGLLEAAEAAGEPERLRQIAAQLLHQPSNADPYVHFLHAEVWCTPEDRATCGCDDGTPPWKRWRPDAQVLASPPTPDRKAIAATAQESSG